jgi:hypothetical protein
MYYKLPIKERMELMKSYRKANPDMSYRDMVNDYNTSYEKFYNGGIKEEPFFKKESDKIVAKEKMLKSLKPTDFKTQKANYEEATRGANQMDGSGISSAELAYRYAKLTDPSGITSGTEIVKNAYLGNEQDPYDYLGLLKIPYIKEGIKQLPKLTKNINKLAVINKVVTKGHDIEEEYKYGGVQKFGDGGKKKESSKTVIYTDKALFDKAYKDEQDSLNAFNNDKKWEDFLKNTPDNFYTKKELDKRYEDARKKASADKYWKFAVKTPSGSVKEDVERTIYSKDGDYVAGYSPVYKKPVVHNIYQPPVEPLQDTIKPVIKDIIKQKPIVNNVDSGLTRRWNFNTSNPTLEYYDKSNKLVKSEYYKNMNDFKQGKQIKQ